MKTFRSISKKQASYLAIASLAAKLAAQITNKASDDDSADRNKSAYLDLNRGPLL